MHTLKPRMDWGGLVVVAGWVIAGLDVCVDRNPGLYCGAQTQTLILSPAPPISGRKIIVFIQLVI